ncbi:hypothetical protein CDAR_34991 [Caerostris darwini]|uniref:Uncharacterized protein n=1 Tax=Caerostris darwini TaxID=1538125 RepID=A0AAV4VVZ0_9ARAC|nr:hypothetical protein CDAR_34991 [Caerostris darwini]
MLFSVCIPNVAAKVEKCGMNHLLFSWKICDLHQQRVSFSCGAEAKTNHVYPLPRKTRRLFIAFHYLLTAITPVVGNALSVAHSNLFLLCARIETVGCRPTVKAVVAICNVAETHASNLGVSGVVWGE